MPFLVLPKFADSGELCPVRTLPLFEVFRWLSAKDDMIGNKRTTASSFCVHPNSCLARISALLTSTPTCLSRNNYPFKKHNWLRESTSTSWSSFKEFKSVLCALFWPIMTNSDEKQSDKRVWEAEWREEIYERWKEVTTITVDKCRIKENMESKQVVEQNEYPSSPHAHHLHFFLQDWWQPDCGCLLKSVLSCANT